MRDPLRARGNVEKPFMAGDCWALKRVYTGSLFAAHVNCAKAARREHLTCHWHQHLEDEAQALRAKLEKKKHG